MARAVRAGGGIAVLVVALFAVAACKRTPERTRVTLQAFADPVETAAYRTLIEAFQVAHPDIRVELSPVGQQRDHMARLATAFAGGEPPDLFLINYRRFGQFAAKGVLEPLGPRLAKPDAGPRALDEGDFYPQPLEAFRFRGELVCLPQNASTQVVYWNRALFAEAKVPPPERPWKWDAFMEAARALTKETPAGKQHGLAFEPTFIRIAPFVLQSGGKLVDDLDHPTRLVFNSREAQRGLTRALGMRAAGVVPTLTELRSENAESRFARGRAGMIINSRRFTATLREVPGLDWDVAPLPVDYAEATMLHADAYCLSRSSKVKDAAWRFVEYALGPTGATILARTGRTVPSLRSVAEGPAFLDPTARPASAKVFLEELEHAYRTPNIAQWHEIETKADAIVEEWFFNVHGGGGYKGKDLATVLSDALNQAIVPILKEQ